MTPSGYWLTANVGAQPPSAHRQTLEALPELAGVLNSTRTALETAGTSPPIALLIQGLHRQRLRMTICFTALSVPSKEAKRANECALRAIFSKKGRSSTALSV
jgi:hypothetical protein